MDDPCPPSLTEAIVSGSQRKVKTATATKESVGRALEGRAPELTSEEERVVRARHGAPLSREAKLERKATGEGHDELLLIELELFRRYRAYRASLDGSGAARERVVKTLRRKR
jgi:hypothetical protein